MTPDQPELTIAIPIGPAHDGIAERAMQSVKTQAIPVKGVRYVDHEERGSGYARNQLLERVTTPYVAFLDADDWLEPEFSSLLLAAAKVSGANYVYSSAYVRSADTGEDVFIRAPKRCYCFDNGWQTHMITAVLKTEWARAVGGFDETLPGMEDTDFFHRLHEAGHCGILVDEPLVHLTERGLRSSAFQVNPDQARIKRNMEQRYNKGTSMSCCQGDGVKNEGPHGERQPGDVLVEVIGTPVNYVGWETGRIYPRLGYGERMWADPRDVRRDPRRLQQVEDIPVKVETATETLHTAEDVANVFEGMRQNGAYVYMPQVPVQPRGKVSVADVINMAKASQHAD